MRKPVIQPALDEPQHHLVHRGEHFGVLDPDGGQRVDVEKAAVVDLVGGDAPVAKAIRLVVQQCFELVETGRVPFASVVGFDRALERLAHLGTALDQGRQPAPRDLAFAIALADRFALDFRPRRQMLKRRHDALQLHALGHLGGEFFGHPLEGLLEHRHPAARIGREAALVVADDKPHVLVGQLQFLGFENLAELIAQHRQQHFAAQRLLGRIPVDVEVARKGGSLAVFEHVLPPGVVRVIDAHVVGHDVDQQSESVPLKRFGQQTQLVLVAQARLELPMVDHVVAVRASLSGSKKGGEVESPDAQLGAIVDQPPRVIETHGVPQLEPVGGSRYGRLTWHHGDLRLIRRPVSRGFPGETELRLARKKPNWPANRQRGSRSRNCPIASPRRTISHINRQTSSERGKHSWAWANPGLRLQLACQRSVVRGQGGARIARGCGALRLQARCTEDSRSSECPRFIICRLALE